MINGFKWIAACDVTSRSFIARGTSAHKYSLSALSEEHTLMHLWVTSNINDAVLSFLVFLYNVSLLYWSNVTGKSEELLQTAGDFYVHIWSQITLLVRSCPRFREIILSAAQATAPPAAEWLKLQFWGQAEDFICLNLTKIHNSTSSEGRLSMWTNMKKSSSRST